MPIYSKAHSWGGNSISQNLFTYLDAILPGGKTILELGSGWASAELAKYWNVISIEDDEEWFKKYHPQAFLVPKTSPEGWYDRDILKQALSGLKYDLLLIDGPWDGRKHFPDHLDLFDTSVTMVFDDVRRAVGQEVIRKVSEAVGREYTIIGESGSMFGVIE